jgi:hypothetical protein
MHYKAYIILVHQNPKQLAKLIQLLQDPFAVFFIHLDDKVKIDAFIFLESKNVLFVRERIKCNWAGYSLVKATHNSLKEAYKFFKKKSINSYHCLLLSGQDLPLKTTKTINDFLSLNKDTSFFNYWQLPYKNWYDGGMFRLKNLYLFNVKSHSKLNRRINKVINRSGQSSCLPLYKLQAIDANIQLYGSSQWFIINHDALSALIQNDQVFKKFSRALRFSFAPDELVYINFFKYIQNQEILNIENKHTTHVIFEGANPNPKYLEPKDLNDIGKDYTLFARKFDSNINLDALKAVEKRITN